MQVLYLPSCLRNTTEPRRQINHCYINSTQIQAFLASQVIKE